MAEKKLKIIHLNESISESSVPYRLMIAFEKAGIHSEILTRRTAVDDERIHVVSKSLLAKVLIKADSFFSKTTKKNSNFPFSYFHVGYNLANDKRVMSADIIIIHWLGAEFLSANGIRKILELGKPVILVCHDSGHFTGGCHVRMGCNKYKDSCGMCPQLDTNKRKDSSYKLLRIKKKAFLRDNLFVVSPSKWMDGNVENSSALKNKEHQVIPNPIDTELFKPLVKKKIKEKYGANIDGLVILFGAVNPLSSPYKGYNEFLECLVKLSEKYPDIGKIDVYIFGSNGENQKYNEKITLNYLGFLDENGMVEAYNLADVYVVSSLEDSFNNTVAESLAAETPVVSFATGGIVDIIDHKRNGYLAEVGDSEQLADGIFWVIDNNDDNKLGKAGREKVLNNFSCERISDEYRNLFHKLVSERDNSFLAVIKNWVSVAFQKSDSNKPPIKESIEIVAILLGIVGLLGQGIRTLAYHWYKLFFIARLGVYGISPSDFSFEKMGIMYDLLFLISIGVIILAMNMLAYKLVLNNKSYKWALKMALTSLFEGTFGIFMVLSWYGYDIVQIIMASLIEWKKMLYCVILYFILALFANYLGMAAALTEKRYGRGERKWNEGIKEIAMVGTILIMVITIAMPFIGRNFENGRHDYKYLYLNNGLENESVIKNEYGASAYPIVYEDDNFYYLSQFITGESDIEVERNYYKIVDKENQEVFYVDNINVLLSNKLE